VNKDPCSDSTFKFPFVEHLELTHFRGDSYLHVLDCFSALTSLDLTQSRIFGNLPASLNHLCEHLQFFGLWYEPPNELEPLKCTCEELLSPGTRMWPRLEVLFCKIGNVEEEVSEEERLSFDNVKHMCTVIDGLPMLRVWSVTMTERVLCDPENIRGAMKQAFKKPVHVEDINGPESLRECVRARVEGKVRIFYHPLVTVSSE